MILYPALSLDWDDLPHGVSSADLPNRPRNTPTAIAKLPKVLSGRFFIIQTKLKNRVALVSFDTDQTSVIIENKALASTQKALFETAWELIK